MLPKMKVLYLVPSAGYGGAETFLQHTAKYHRAGTVEAIYLCFRDGPLVQTLRDYGRTVFVLGRPPRLRKPWTILAAVKEIARLARAERTHIIHSTLAYAALFGSLAALMAKKKHVWFQHGPVSGWMDRLAAALPSELIYVNSQHTENLQKRLNRRRALKSITLGVDPERVARALRETELRRGVRREWGVREDSFLIGAVCRPQPQKGLELFVRAVHRLSRRRSGPVEAVIIGASLIPTPYEKKILALIGSLGAPVRLVPASGQALEQMPAFDLLVSSAISPEAFGLTLIESMSMGVPTVAPREGGPLDILDPGETGFFFRARDLEDLANTMESAAALPAEQRKNLSHRAREAVQRRFLATRTVGELEDSYANIL